MARHGQLTIINLTGEDLLIKAHQKSRGPKEFTVQAGGTTRRTGIRIDRSDWPVNYSRRVDFHDKKTGEKLYDKKYTYKVSLAYELILSCDKIGGNFRVTVLDSLPLGDLETLDAEFLAGLKRITEEGLDCMLDSDTENEDAELEPDYS